MKTTNIFTNNLDIDEAMNIDNNTESLKKTNATARIPGYNVAIMNVEPLVPDSDEDEDGQK